MSKVTLDKFGIISFLSCKNMHCDQPLIRTSRRDGSDEMSQHMFSMTREILSKSSSKPHRSGALGYCIYFQGNFSAIFHCLH